MSTTIITSTTPASTSTEGGRIVLLRSGAAAGADRPSPSTIICALLGVALAEQIGRRASRPRRTFTRAAWALAATSCIAPFLVPADLGTRLTLVTAHVVAATVIIPALASRLRR